MTSPITIKELDERIRHVKDNKGTDLTEDLMEIKLLIDWKTDIIARNKKVEEIINSLTQGGIHNDYEGMIDAEELKLALGEIS